MNDIIPCFWYSLHLAAQKSRTGILHDLWKIIESNPEKSLTESTKEALNLLMEDENAVVIGDQTYVIDYMMKSEKKFDWKAIPEPLFTSPFGLALPKGSPFTNVFSRKWVFSLISSYYKYLYFRMMTVNLVELVIFLFLVNPETDCSWFWPVHMPLSWWSVIQIILIWSKLDYGFLIV